MKKLVFTFLALSAALLFAPAVSFASMPGSFAVIENQDALSYSMSLAFSNTGMEFGFGSPGMLAAVLDPVKLQKVASVTPEGASQFDRAGGSSSPAPRAGQSEALDVAATSTPEPNSLVLLGMGLLALAFGLFLRAKSTAVAVHK